MDNDEITEADALDQDVCGCGTVKDAIETAIEMVLKAHAGEDCMKWHFVVIMLAQHLSANVTLLDIAHRNGGDFDDASEKAQEIGQGAMEFSSAVMRVCSKYIKDELWKGYIANLKKAGITDHLDLPGENPDPDPKVRH